MMTIQERIEKHPGVSEVFFEEENGWWIYLKCGVDGYCWDDEGLHTIREDNIKAAYRALLDARPCSCKDCLQERKLATGGAHA